MMPLNVQLSTGITKWRLASKNLDPAAEDVLEHDPITHQATEGVGKSGGLVFFKKQMPHPGKTITKQWRDDQVVPLLCHEGQHQTHEHK